MDAEVWQERWEILEQQISALQNQLKNSGDFPRKQSLVQLTDCFRDFASKQFLYFYEGFRDDKLLPSDLYPPEHTLIVTLEQIAFDLEALQKAIHQHQDNQAVTCWALRVSETLAWQALKPFMGPFDLSNITVITYFQKFAEIRMIPYASVALVGIPISCIPLPINGGSPVIRDYLAIPHELGHFIYWHGRVKDGTVTVRHYLVQQLRGKLTWGEDWVEEIFADIVGCLIAGPAIAQSFQDLQLLVSTSGFFKDDGEHPAPILRPDIYTKVLRKRFDKKWAIALHTRWREGRQEREKNRQHEGIYQEVNGKPGLQFHYQHKDESKPVAEAVHLADSEDDELIDSSLEGPIDVIIKTILSLDNWPKIEWWHDYFPAVPRKNTDPYDLFATHFRSYFIEENKNNKLDQPEDAVDCLSYETSFGEWEKEGKEILRRDKYTEAIQNNLSPEAADREATEAVESDKIYPQIWITVLKAGGWSTKGPVDNPTG